MENILKSIRMPKELINRIQVLSEKEDREFSQMCRVLLKEALKARGEE